jgi:MerR family transcriptional regulator, light-induced transcriptional regulator
LFTIKQASKLTGVPEASLRTWERRYRVVTPRRSEAGYRLYDRAAVAALATMRRLIDAGWSAAEAGRAVREGTAPADGSGPAAAARGTAGNASVDIDQANASTYTEQFLSSAARLDTEGIEDSLDRGLSTGSFEHAVDAWLFPTLVALGEGWAHGEIDVAGEHLASHAVLRRLSAAFEAAGTRSRGPSVVVGLPPGSLHELGALSFGTALRRRGLDVLYLGADVPSTSWNAAVTTQSARAAVLSVVTPADRAAATATAELLLTNHPGLFVASGGACGANLGPGVHTLPQAMSAAATMLDLLLREEPFQPVTSVQHGARLVLSPTRANPSPGDHQS